MKPPSAARDWIADFVGHALLRDLCDDPDWIADAAGELYAGMSNVDDRIAAQCKGRPMNAAPPSAAARAGIPTHLHLLRQ